MKRFIMFFTTAMLLSAVAFSLFSQTKEDNKVSDTLIVRARLVQIPGTFAPNDLYDYVYVMKYRILKVLKGTFKDKEIHVGHYNPLIPRQKIKDKMDVLVDGDVEKFEKGDVHKLILLTPIEDYWNDAVEDEYFDVDMEKKFYALKCDKVQ